MRVTHLTRLADVCDLRHSLAQLGCGLHAMTESWLAQAAGQSCHAVALAATVSAPCLAGTRPASAPALLLAFACCALPQSPSHCLPTWLGARAVMPDDEVCEAPHVRHSLQDEHVQAASLEDSAAATQPASITGRRNQHVLSLTRC